MLILNGTQEESPGPVLTEDEPPHDRVAALQREIEASRSREHAAKVALTDLHRELESAYVRIAQQQEKLKLLVAKVQTQRASAERRPASTAPSLRDTDLAHPDHPYRRQVAPFSAHVTTPAGRLPIVNTTGVARIAALWQGLPKWASGTISTEDAAFLDAILEKIRPDRVHEIGVASGTSSALILSSMAVYGSSAATWLHSHDLIAKCYFDPAHNVGDATREMVPGLLDRWKLNVGTTALDVLRDPPPSGRPLYFIDANHIHPWPTLDLIALLPGLQPGDCVVLHDINLPAKTGGKFPDYGAQWLFEDWTGPRLMPDVAIPNIGAIFIPDDLRLVLPGLVKSLSRPWTLQRPAELDHLHRCEQRLAEFLARPDAAA